MGQDKALLERDGEALVSRQARLLTSLFGEVLLVGGDPPATAPGRRVSDPPGEYSALRGIVAALEAATCPWLLVTATDMPALTPDLLLGLVASQTPEIDAIVPRTDRPEPLCALYRVDPVLPVARERLAAHEYVLRGLLDELRVTWLEARDLALVDGAGALLNVNTPEEWRAFNEQHP
jgi:molybdopterin-guanine dinucleotide biosynthesis protein A